MQWWWRPPLHAPNFFHGFWLLPFDWIWPDQTRSQTNVCWRNIKSLSPIGLSSKVAAFSAILGLQGALSMGRFHIGILLFQPTFLTAPWFGWIVHCQLSDPLRNTVYRSVVVASGFGMFNRSFHWVPQMNLIWIEGRRTNWSLARTKQKVIDISQHHGFSTFWIRNMLLFQNLLVCLKLKCMVNIFSFRDVVLLESSPDLHIGK